MFNDITKAKHYNSHPSGIEAIELMREMHQNFAQAFKYVYRAGIKGDLLHDLRKAEYYMIDFEENCKGAVPGNLFAGKSHTLAKCAEIMVKDDHPYRRAVLLHILIGNEWGAILALRDWIEAETKDKE